MKRFWNTFSEVWGFVLQDFPEMLGVVLGVVSVTLTVTSLVLGLSFGIVWFFHLLFG